MGGPEGSASSGPSPSSKAESPEPKRTSDGLRWRIVTGVLLAGGYIGTLYVSPMAFLFYSIVFILFGQTEFYRAVRKAGYSCAPGIGLVLGLLILLGAYNRGLPGIAFGMAVAIPATALWIAADPGRSDSAAKGLGMTIFGVFWLPFLGAHVTMMSLLPDGADITITVTGLTAFNDIGAYAGGRMFGRTQLAPTISPKKSLEGAISGTVLIGILALTVGPMLTDLGRPTLLLLAALTSILAPFGDLAESLIKRDLRIKDMGGILPGHGGVMDRIDALLFVVPVCYWVVR